MLAVVAASWALFLGIGLIMLGNGLQGSLLGLRAALEGFPTAVTGLVMTGYYVGFLAGSTLVPRLVRRVGHIRVFAALASLASTAVLIHAVMVDPFSWTAMRLVTGFCYAGLYVVAESWLNDRATNQTRGQLLSVYMVIMFSGLAGGQLLLNLADPGSFELFIVASVLVSLALVPILLTVSPAPEIGTPASIGLLGLLRISPTGVIGCLGTGMAHGALFGMGAVYANTVGLSVAEVSLFMAVAILGGVALQWPIGHLSDRFDRRRILTGVTFVAAITAFAATVLTGPLGPEMPVWGLLFIMAVFGGMTLPMYSLSIAHTNDFLEPEQMVAASGGLVLVGGIGAIFGPITVAGVMSVMGPTGFYWSLGMIHAAMGAFAIYRMTRRASVPVAEQGAFVSVPPPASPVAAALNPVGPEMADEAGIGSGPGISVDPEDQRR